MNAARAVVERHLPDLRAAAADAAARNAAAWRMSLALAAARAIPLTAAGALGLAIIARPGLDTVDDVLALLGPARHADDWDRCREHHYARRIADPDLIAAA